MLYVVAWPVLAEADDTALRRLRAQYHSGEALLIGPHFTLVFGADAHEEARLSGLLDGLAGRRPFWFVLDRLVRHDLTPPSRSAYLYAVPADDAEPRQLLAHLARCAERRRLGVEAGQPQQAFQQLLPALGLGWKLANLDLPRFVDVGLGLGDIERKLQPA